MVFKLKIRTRKISHVKVLALYIVDPVGLIPSTT